jgi:hypothetical protein
MQGLIPEPGAARRAAPQSPKLKHDVKMGARRTNMIWQ